MTLPNVVFNQLFAGKVKKFDFVKLFQKFEVWGLRELCVGLTAVKAWWPGLWWHLLTEDGFMHLSCPPGWD